MIEPIRPQTSRISFHNGQGVTPYVLLTFDQTVYEISMWQLAGMGKGIANIFRKAAEMTAEENASKSGIQKLIKGTL